MTTQNQPSRAATITSWVLAVLTGLMMLGAGGSKLAGAAPHPTNFAHWGYPLWFMYLTGALEVLGAIGTIVPRTRGIAALGLVGVMLGAVATHLKAGEPPFAPLVPLALAATVAYLNRGQVLALFGRGGNAASKTATV